MVPFQPAALPGSVLGSCFFRPALSDSSLEAEIRAQKSGGLSRPIKGWEKGLVTPTDLLAPPIPRVFTGMGPRHFFAGRVEREKP